MGIFLQGVRRFSWLGRTLSPFFGSIIFLIMTMRLFVRLQLLIQHTGGLTPGLFPTFSAFSLLLLGLLTCGWRFWL